MKKQDYIAHENGKITDVVSDMGSKSLRKEYKQKAYVPVSLQMANQLRKDLRRLQNPERLSEVMGRAVQINMR